MILHKKLIRTSGLAEQEVQNYRVEVEGGTGDDKGELSTSSNVEYNKRNFRRELERKDAQEYVYRRKS